jgi:UDP-N-acetylglucosamine 4,6-dehydratase
LYGATKATAEKLFLHANVYAPHTTKFSVCRYGNVFGSRGSVVQIWKEQYEKTGKITITNNDMTRFWIQIQDVAKFILNRLAKSKGSEIFVPNMKSCDMKTFAKAVQPKAGIVFTGVRTGEKIHECLITKEESEYTKIFESHYEIKFDKKVVAVPFCVTSANSEKYTVEEMKEFLEEKK